MIKCCKWYGIVTLDVESQSITLPVNTRERCLSVCALQLEILYLFYYIQIRYGGLSWVLDLEVNQSNIYPSFCTLHVISCSSKVSPRKCISVEFALLCTNTAHDRWLFLYGCREELIISGSVCRVYYQRNRLRERWNHFLLIGPV